MEPKTPKELYWAKMAGEDVTLPEPKTPTEHYMKEIANKSSAPSVLIVNATSSDGVSTLDKTWEEIHDAGLAVIKTTAPFEARMTWIVRDVYARSGCDYRVIAMRTGDGDEEPNEKRIYKATTRDGYPSLSLT